MPECCPGRHADTNVGSDLFEWAIISAPLSVAVGVPSVPLPGWPLPKSERVISHRILTMIWLLTAIVIPWFIAWLTAAFVSRNVAASWVNYHANAMPGILIVPVFLLVAISTYALASAAGVFVTIAVDAWLERHKD